MFEFKTPKTLSVLATKLDRSLDSMIATEAILQDHEQDKLALRIQSMNQDHVKYLADKIQDNALNAPTTEQLKSVEAWRKQLAK